MSNDTNFCPNIKCPFCGNHQVVAISGFGSELNIRVKYCKKCDKEFKLLVYVTTCDNSDFTDGDLSAIKSQIKILKENRKKTAAELLIQRDVAIKINEEAMEMAREMRRKRSMN